MTAAGRFLKKWAPGVYAQLVGHIDRARRLFQSGAPYITDDLGGSFKEYVKTHDKEVLLARLLSGLDAESQTVVRCITDRVLFFDDAGKRASSNRVKRNVQELLPVEVPHRKREIQAVLRQCSRQFNLLGGRPEASVFYFFHGLTLLPPKVVARLRGTHLMDVGAYVGDSAIALSRYGFSKTFSLEMSAVSAGRYTKNMARFGMNPDHFMLIREGVARADGGESVLIRDSGSAGTSIFRHGPVSNTIAVSTRSADSLVDAYGIEPGFIKVDIEGAAKEFVLGATRTLTRFRPVLSIAIYHNPMEYFEVKPLLEEMLPDYSFMIRKLDPGISQNLIHSEVVLLGWSNEMNN